MLVKIDKRYAFKVFEDYYELIEFVSRQKKNSNEQYEAEQNIGYYTDLTSLILKIVQIKLAKKNKVVELKEFLKEYKEIKEELEKIINV